MTPRPDPTRPIRRPLPPLVGVSLSEARRRAGKAGVTLDITVENHPSFPRLQVIAQSPAAGSVSHDGIVHVRVSMPSWMRHLPEVFETEDSAQNGFLRRYLQLSQHLLLPLEECIADSRHSLSPRHAPPTELALLASWLALPLNDEWSDSQRRRVLLDAPRLWASRGTPHGLRLALELLANAQATVVEHPPPLATARIGHRFRIGFEGAVGQPIPEWHWIEIVVDEALDSRRLALIHAVVASQVPAHARWVVRRKEVEAERASSGFRIGEHVIGHRSSIHRQPRDHQVTKRHRMSGRRRTSSSHSVPGGQPPRGFIDHEESVIQTSTRMAWTRGTR